MLRQAVNSISEAKHSLEGLKIHGGDDGIISSMKVFPSS